MENVLAAVAIYFTLPLTLGGLVAVLRALVDGLARLIHGPPARAPEPLPPPEIVVRIPLARLNPT